MPRITIIYNPVAGNRRPGLLDRTVAAFDRDGWQVTVIGTTGPATAANLAAQAVLGGAEVIAAAGGDGTVREVVAGMAGSGLPLGIVPMGTANVLAAEFGLPRQPEAIAGTFAAGRRRALHIPEIDGRPFLMMVGAGFDGAVVGAIGPALKRRLGKAAFVVQGLRAFLRGPAAAIAVEVDGVPHCAEWVVVTNVSRYGGPYRLARDADPGTPALTAVLFRRAGRLALAGHLLRLGFGLLERSPGVLTVAAQEVRLSNAHGPPSTTQIDGDAAGALPCRIAASGSFVDILVPPDALTGT